MSEAAQHASVTIVKGGRDFHIEGGGSIHQLIQCWPKGVSAVRLGFELGFGAGSGLACFLGLVALAHKLITAIF